MDEAAFEALFRGNYGRLVAFALTIVPARADAEDVVQQVFANVWRSRETLTIRGPERAYLFRAVRNAALNRQRAGHTQAGLSGSPALASIGDPAADPSDVLISREAAEALNAALDTLGPRCRQVLRLRWIDGLTHAEIAEALGITRKAVESNITRGLRALRQLLDRPIG